MRLDALRERVQPALEQDFDALHAEFVDESGDDTAIGFLEHLRTHGLVSEDLHREVLRTLIPADPAEPAGPPTWDPTTPTIAPRDTDTGPPDDFMDEDEELTVVAADPLVMARLRAEALGEAPPPGAEPYADFFEDDEEEEPQPTYEIDLPNRGAADPEATDALLEDELEEVRVERAGGRRTMFRRVTGGELRETAPPDVERPRRRRRQEAAPDDADGRYTFVGTVGEGAMGCVHLAEDGVLHRKVAYKAMSADIRDQTTLAGKFTAEAQITAQLAHPNIVPVYNLVSPHAYTMKLIQGRTLQEIIEDAAQSGGRRSADNTLPSRLELFMRVCDAIAYAHSRGVVHRDLKPDNIMVGAFGELYVMDWGIARVMRGGFPDVVQVAATSDEGDLVIGTPGYMSPEQAEGRNAALDGRSDQYALGLILFELISLRPAIKGNTALRVVMLHQDGHKDPLRHVHGARIPPELAAIVHKATALEPGKRYPSVRELADDVRRFLRGDAVLAKPDSLVQALLRWMGRHREATLALFFLLSGVSGLLVMGVVLYAQLALSSAKAREQALSNAVTTVSRQGSLIDGQFVKYEGLLSLITATATDNLSRPLRDRDPLYLASDYADPSRAPDGMIPSSRYGRPIHLGHSVFAIAPGLPRDQLEADMQRLQDLDRHFYRVLLRSHSEAAAAYTPKRAERALADVGVPVAWAYVGLDSGVFTQYPGHAAIPAGFDHRDSAWYDLARGRQGPTWGAPAADVGGLGLVLTCAQALYTEDKEFLGVAGLDVTFETIIEDLLEAPELQDAAQIEALLLDPAGRVVVHSSGRAEETPESPELRPFRHQEVLQAIKERRSGGSLQAAGPEGREVVIYTRMPSIGWYYVVAGPRDEVLR